MNKQWETDNCATMRAHYEVYSIPQAAALWCGIPENEIHEILNEAQQVSQTGLGRSIWRHPSVPCLEPRSRAIAEAIESGDIPHGREDAKPVSPGEHVAHERRHFFGRHLRDWMQEAFPNEKPEFLFYEIERNTHISLTIESFESLRAEKEMLARRIEKAEEEYKKLRSEKDSIAGELEKMKREFEGNEPPSARAELTYNTIIGTLLGIIFGEVPGVDPHQSINNKSDLISKISSYYDEYKGISDRTLYDKFGDAKKALGEPK